MRQRFGDDWARIAKLSIIEETASGEKTVGALCQHAGVGSHGQHLRPLLWPALGKRAGCGGFPLPCTSGSLRISHLAARCPVQVRMAYLAVIASAHVNGVAKIHSGAQPAFIAAMDNHGWDDASPATRCAHLLCLPPISPLPCLTRGPCLPAADILKHDVFGPFYEIFPEKFQNKTNGCEPAGAQPPSLPCCDAAGCSSRCMACPKPAPSCPPAAV